jgi:hypothetical protein
VAQEMGEPIYGWDAIRRYFAALRITSRRCCRSRSLTCGSTFWATPRSRSLSPTPR